jgi:glycine betaine/proline transport system ATP-binding protein
VSRSIACAAPSAPVAADRVARTNQRNAQMVPQADPPKAFASPEASSRPVKLSCRNVWKLYGPSAGAVRGLPADAAESAHVAERLRAEGSIVAAANVSFDVHEGEIFVIMGLSGSGKSTMIRCLSRLLEPSAGEILLDGEDLLRKSGREMTELRRHKMGMVFQNFGLLPHLNVLDNVALPLRLKGMGRRERQARSERVIALVGLEGRESAFPAELSGGQAQRVGIARSLAGEPEMWYLDEPFSALDPLIRRQMQGEFLRLQRELRKTIIFVTHDFLEALKIADRVAIMKDGAVVQVGRPSELILRPANDYVAEFTCEVPWELVLRAADIADPARLVTAGMGRVAGDTTVALILKYLSTHPAGVVATAADGSPLGVVTAEAVVAALASGMKEEGHVTVPPQALTGT